EHLFGEFRAAHQTHDGPEFTRIRAKIAGSHLLELEIFLPARSKSGGAKQPADRKLDPFDLFLQNELDALTLADPFPPFEHEQHIGRGFGYIRSPFAVKVA